MKDKCKKSGLFVYYRNIFQSLILIYMLYIQETALMNFILKKTTTKNRIIFSVIINLLVSNYLCPKHLIISKLNILFICYQCPKHFH